MQTYKKWNIEDMGLVSIDTLHKRQCLLVEEKKATPEKEDTILFAELFPVITKGRNFHKESLLHDLIFFKKKNIKVIDVNRGGDVTYHGPGQLIIYLIAHLDNYGNNLRQWVTDLEQSIIQLLSRLGLTGYRHNDLRGVWVNNGKISSIGLGCSHWISYHGLSLNVSPDLSPFSWIKPCGIEDLKVISIESLRGQAPHMDKIKNIWTEEFKQIMKVDDI